MDACALGDTVAQLRPLPAQKSSCQWRVGFLRTVGENAPQVDIIVDWPAPREISALLRVMFVQRVRERAQRLNLMSIRLDWRLASNLPHDFVNVLELAERQRPSLVIRPPVAVRVEPNRECLGEIFNGMPLRIPAGKIDRIVAALRLRFVGSRILLARVTEELSIAIASMKRVSLVEAVPRLMAKNPPAFSLAGTLNFQHLRPLEPH